MTNEDDLIVPIPPPPKGAIWITRGGLYAFSLAIGLAVSLVIGGVVAVALLLDNQNDRIKNQGRVTRHLGVENRAAVIRLDEVTEQLRKITSPTPEEFRKQLEIGIRRCLKVPECKRLFPGVKVSANGTLRNTPPGTVPARELSPAQGNRNPPRARVRPPAGRRRPPRRGPPARSPSPPSSPPPSSPPQAPIGIDAPLPIQLCTGIITVNC